MAADSGYHSFSSPSVPHVDDSSETSETSNSFDLQEFSDGQTSSEVQAFANSECLPANSKKPTNPQPAIPLITSTTANKARGPNKVNLSRKANAISRVDASTKASSLTKANVWRKSRGYARLQKSTLPKAQPSLLIISRDDDNGQDFGACLGSTGLESTLAQHFKIVVSMTEHMNHALFNAEANHGIKQSVMEEVKALAEEMIYFFDGLQESFKVQMEEIKVTKGRLPTLGDNVEEHHLEAAIKIWALKVCENVRMPRRSEQRLLNSFTGVYDANVYNPFLQLRRRNARHNIRELSVHLDSVYNAIEGAIELYEQIILEMSGFRRALEGAFDDFRRLPHAWFDWWGYRKGQGKSSTEPLGSHNSKRLQHLNCVDRCRVR